jgi:hypothetical protein
MRVTFGRWCVTRLLVFREWIRAGKGCGERVRGVGENEARGVLRVMGIYRQLGTLMTNDIEIFVV